MGIELEWFTLLVFHILGTSIFGRFESETPWWRLSLKWAIVMALTWGIYSVAGHWALLAILVPGLGGTIFHFAWCKKNGIDPIEATPRRKYWELRGWAWLD